MKRENNKHNDNAKNVQNSFGFKVPTAIAMKSIILWDVMPCSLMEAH
jgi:hypothetical protein